MDREQYYRESIELQKKQVRATESQENWLQTLMGYLIIAAVAVIYVTVCIIGLIVHYWYISIPMVIVIVAVVRSCRARAQVEEAPRPINPMFRSSVSMEYMKKEMAGTEFADLYAPQGRGCKEAR
jgi:Flp pilus assembly protein TadB